MVDETLKECECDYIFDKEMYKDKEKNDTKIDIEKRFIKKWRHLAETLATAILFSLLNAFRIIDLKKPIALGGVIFILLLIFFRSWLQDKFVNKYKD